MGDVYHVHKGEKKREPCKKQFMCMSDQFMSDPSLTMNQKRKEKKGKSILIAALRVPLSQMTRIIATMLKTHHRSLQLNLLKSYPHTIQPFR